MDASLIVTRVGAFCVLNKRNATSTGGSVGSNGVGSVGGGGIEVEVVEE